MFRRIASWRGRGAVHLAEAAADRPDGEAVRLIGATLRSSYCEEDDTLDDRLVALMLELSVEPLEVEAPRPRLRLIP